MFYIFPYKSIRDQIWPCHKICQGQPRAIIWTNLVVLDHPMLHTKFQDHQPFGSREDDFLKVFTIYGHGGHLDQDRFNKLSFPHPKEDPCEIWLQSAQWLLRRCLKMLTYIQTTEVYLYYKLTDEPKGSGELKKTTTSKQPKTHCIRRYKLDSLFNWI